MRTTPPFFTHADSAVAWRIVGAAILCGLLLSACSLPKIGGMGTLTSTPAATPEDNEKSTNHPDASDLAPTSTKDADQSDASGVTELTPAVIVDANNPVLNDLILFTSLSDDPFINLDLAIAGVDPPERHLWAISPDGQRAGRISPAGQASALWLPGNENGPIKLVAAGLDVSHAALEQIPLPDDCLSREGGACGQFTFSPEGRTLAYFTSPESCGRSLTLLDLTMNQVINTWTNVHWFYFFQDGSVVLSLGDCSGKSNVVYLYVPENDKQAGLGKEGEMYWDPTHQAVLMMVGDEANPQSGLWGFNLATSRVFLWMEQENVLDDTPIWLPGGQEFVYQHRIIHVNPGNGDVFVEGPRQIIMMNAWSRNQRLLAYDGRSDYHLCLGTGESCPLLYGDWLKIRRTPFEVSRVPFDEINDLPEARCSLYGLDCQESPEDLALNWQTGEMLPWDEAGVTEAEPPPAVPPPDLDRQPVYSDPAGHFAFYTDSGGRNLWYVPASGDPVMWVTEGENFVYLP